MSRKKKDYINVGIKMDTKVSEILEAYCNDKGMTKTVLHGEGKIAWKCCPGYDDGGAGEVAWAACSILRLRLYVSLHNHTNKYFEDYIVFPI